MPDKEIMVQIREREEQRPWRALDAFDASPSGSQDALMLINALGSLVDDWRATADLYEKAKLKGAMTAYVGPLRHAATELDKVIKGLEQPRRAPLGQLQQPERIPTDRVLPPVSAGLDEPVHRFTVGPGATGTVCTAMVERDGAGDQCGRYASHPAHRMQTPAANLASLESLVADSAAKHKTLDAEGVPDFRGPGDLADPNVGRVPGAGLDRALNEFDAETRRKLDSLVDHSVVGVINLNSDAATTIDFPGQASGEEVAAYLRGETDDLPGEPLQPSSVRDQMLKCVACGENPPARGKAICADCAVFPDEILADLVKVSQDYPQPPKMTSEEIAAWKRGEIDPESEAAAYLRDVVDPWESDAERAAREALPAAAGVFPPPLDAWALTTARQTLETSPVTIPPVPLLGQPGNAGAGHDHTYVPPGGVPATYAELMTPVPLAALPAHISHSQIGTAGDCSVKYRLQRLPRLGANNPSGMAETEQIPQWANIGGNAFHAAIEHIERVADSVETIVPDVLWQVYFDAECQKIEAFSPVPRSRWRASRGGSEGETWWNANGPLMIERYLKARPAERSAEFGQPGRLAIEFEETVQVPTPYGPIAYKAVIDRVTARDAGQAVTTLIIRDYKSGYSMPDSTQQLGEYTQVLRLLGVPPQVKILGSYFNARKGVWTAEVDLEAEGWTAEWFAYHVASGHAERLKLTTGPTPARPSSYCGGCSVRWACPVKNGARR